MDAREQVDRTVTKVRQIVADLDKAERRLRDADVDNLTYRQVFHARALARALMRELDPDSGQ